MKKNLLVALLFMLGVGSVRADLMWYEGYNYTNGRIDIVSTNGLGGTNWFRFSGSGNDAIVSNNMEQVAATGGSPVSRQDDVLRFFPAAYTNGGPIPVFVSFTIIVTNTPPAAGVYFCLFTDGIQGNGGDFIGKLFALTGTNLVGGTNLYRLGCSGTASTPSAVFPVDLAFNTPYQVVFEYDAVSSDPTGNQSILWVNPVGSSDKSVLSKDTVTGSLQSKVIQDIAFRQASSSSNFFALITNLDAATTFDDAALNIAPTNTPVAPTIIYPPVASTNLSAIATSLSVVATGQGLGSLTYQWQENGTNINNPTGANYSGSFYNSNQLSFPNPATNDSGSYSVIVTTPFGLSVTSTPVLVQFNFNTNPPIFTTQPQNTAAYPNANATFTAVTYGAGPITYQWNYNSNAISGANSSTLTISGVNSNNGTTGTYEVDATNPNGTTHSSNAVLSVTNPTVTTITALRGLVDKTFFLPTNLTTYYTVTGTVINKTNMAVGNYQAAITDGTAGISVYCYGGLTTTPNLGDVIQVTGPVGTYNSLEEFTIYNTDPSTSVTIISTGNPAPLPTVLPFTFTNSAAYGGTSNALHRYESTLVMLTNVYIPAGIGGTNIFASANYTITDQTGTNGIIWYVYYGFTNIVGTPIPSFAYTLTGVMSEYLSNTATNRSSGYEFWVTDVGDIVTNPPPQVTITESKAGALSWVAVPYSYSYSVSAATNVNGPYLPVKTGLVFPSTLGSYTDTNTSAPQKFYQVTSP